VARGVGQHELALRRREVPVGDVDRDALLTLGAQAVDQQRQVRGRQTLVDRRALHGLDLVGQHGLRVIEQAADQRRLAVVHGARRGEAQEVLDVVRFGGDGVGVRSDRVGGSGAGTHQK
jgi:hypothetical protein